MAASNPQTALKSVKSPRDKRSSPGSIVRSSITIENFQRFLEVDLALTHTTAINHSSKIGILLRNIGKPVDDIGKDDIRGFLESVKSNYSANTYACYIKALRRFFRDYRDKPELAAFRFPTIPFKPKMLMFDKEDLQRFYDAIEHPIVKVMFIGYCVTGLRRNDLLFLKKNELFPKDRMIIKNTESKTKHRWITFYNRELKESLQPYLTSRVDDNPRVFKVAKWKTFGKHWIKAKKKTGLSITPKDLRDWFCIELTNLGVPDRYLMLSVGEYPNQYSLDTTQIIVQND